MRARLGRWAADLHSACGGRRTRDEQLHVTLVFLGDVPQARVPLLRSLAQAVAVPGFTLCFDAPDYWPRKRLVWAAPGVIPDGLAALATALAESLRAAGFEIESRPYFPHVTLIRDARPPQVSSRAGVSWDVEEFVLVESELGSSGSRYRVIGRWPLVPPERPSVGSD